MAVGLFQKMVTSMRELDGPNQLTTGSNMILLILGARGGAIQQVPGTSKFDQSIVAVPTTIGRARTNLGAVGYCRHTGDWDNTLGHWYFPGTYHPPIVP